MYRRTSSYQSIVDKITIAEYLRAFLDELASKENKRTKINNRSQAERIKGLMNIPKNTAFKSLSDIRAGFPYWYEQKVDFISSNLGEKKGFIFYFICNSCGKRRKDLFFPSMIDEPLCRVCCRLQYKQPNRKARAISRIINKQYLSSDDKYMLMKKIKINKEDIANYLSDYENGV